MSESGSVALQSCSELESLCATLRYVRWASQQGYGASNTSRVDRKRLKEAGFPLAPWKNGPTCHRAECVIDVALAENKL